MTSVVSGSDRPQAISVQPVSLPVDDGRVEPTVLELSRTRLKVLKILVTLLVISPLDGERSETTQTR